MANQQATVTISAGSTLSVLTWVDKEGDWIELYLTPVKPS